MEGGRGGHRELEIIAFIEEVTLGGLQRDCEGEWATGLGDGPSRGFCASSRHIPISHGYLYSGPNWKVGWWTICMHPHFDSRTHTLAHSHSLFSALLQQTQPAMTQRRERPDMLHLWWLPSQEGENAKGHWRQKCFCQRLEFVSGAWYSLCLRIMKSAFSF